MTKKDLPNYILDALKSVPGGAMNITNVAKYIWQYHHKELEESGDLFFNWQYDMRWAAVYLRDKKLIEPSNKSPKGVWRLVQPTEC